MESVNKRAARVMKKNIEIDGKEYDVKGTVREPDGFAIHTTGGTFRMKPCKPKPGQSAFWMGLNGFVVPLPDECPQRISWITFDEPDLTNQYPDEVKADYRKYKAHCKKAGETTLSFEQYEKRVAVSDVWKRHETPELAAQYGCIDDPFVLYSQNLEGQMIDPACLHKFKWAAEYMDESGQGEVVFFERLAGPDPLPKGYKNKKGKAKGGRKPAVKDATTRTAIVKECQKRIANGMKPTTAARGVETWAKERFSVTVGYKTILGYVKRAEKRNN